MLLISSSDGFCSSLTFAPGELGLIYQPPAQIRPSPGHINTSAASGVSTPLQTPTQSNAPSLPRPSSSHGPGPSNSPFIPAHPASPARSMSISSVATQESHVQIAEQLAESTRNQNNGTPQVSSVPSLTAASPGAAAAGGLPMYTPPQTPGQSASVTTANTSQASNPIVAGLKREAEPVELAAQDKRRRIAPTLVSGEEPHVSVPPPPPPPAVPEA